MKKQWIAEGVYFVIALAFIGICIGGRKQEEKPVFGSSVTAAPTEAPMQEQRPGTEVVSEPVQDTIPTPETEDLTQNQGQTDENKPVTTASPTATPEPESTLVPTVPGEDEISGRMPGAIRIENANYEQYSNEKNAWWFQRYKGHKPSGSGEGFPIAPFSAYYLDKEAKDEDKVIYLTFDCGYENGYTPAILDTLAEKDVKAMFFVTRDFIVKNPDYVKRMKEEGHLVGNHTVRHLSSPELTPEELDAELYEVAKTMEEMTGYKLDPFFRPPMGEYSERTLKATQDMGYTSVFWSIAYYDYDVNNQPGKEYVTDHFATYHHNGSIILMHNISESNTQALGEVIDNLKAEQYRFAPLTELEH